MEKKKITLEELTTKTPYEAPNGYFDELPLRLQRRIAERPAAVTWSLPVWFRYALPATALAALGVFAGIRSWESQSTPQPVTIASLEDVPNAAITEFLQENEALLNEGELIRLVATHGVQVEEHLPAELEISEEQMLDELSTQNVEELI